MSDIASVIEETLLSSIDTAIEQETSQTAKALMELFKTVVLKKYKVAFDLEKSCGYVHQTNLDKTIDFLFNEACANFRLLHGVADAVKENEIHSARQRLDGIKGIIRNLLESNGIQVIPS